MRILGIQGYVGYEDSTMIQGYRGYRYNTWDRRIQGYRDTFRGIWDILLALNMQAS